MADKPKAEPRAAAAELTTTVLIVEAHPSEIEAAIQARLATFRKVLIRGAALTQTSGGVTAIVVIDYLQDIN